MNDCTVHVRYGMGISVVCSYNNHREMRRRIEYFIETKAQNKIRGCIITPTGMPYSATIATKTGRADLVHPKPPPVTRVKDALTSEIENTKQHKRSQRPLDNFLVASRTGSAPSGFVQCVRGHGGALQTRYSATELVSSAAR